MRPVAMIVYGEVSGWPHRTVVTTDGIGKLSGHYGKGESIIILNAEEVLKNGFPDLDAEIALIEAKRGKKSVEGPR